MALFSGELNDTVSANISPDVCHPQFAFVKQRELAFLVNFLRVEDTLKRTVYNHSHINPNTQKSSYVG